MTRCRKRECRLAAWRDRLCYRHFREKQGLFFDPAVGRFLPVRENPESASHQNANLQSFPETPALQLS